MFEMTYHVCYGNSQSIGIFAGGELWKSWLDHHWIIKCKLIRLPMKFWLEYSQSEMVKYLVLKKKDNASRYIALNIETCIGWTRTSSDLT